MIGDGYCPAFTHTHTVMYFTYYPKLSVHAGRGGFITTLMVLDNLGKVSSGEGGILPRLGAGYKVD